MLVIIDQHAALSWSTCLIWPEAAIDLFQKLVNDESGRSTLGNKRMPKRCSRGSEKSQQHTNSPWATCFPTASQTQHFVEFPRRLQPCAEPSQPSFFSSLAHAGVFRIGSLVWALKIPFVVDAAHHTRCTRPVRRCCINRHPASGSL